jgi:hypothetical protein
VKLRRLLHEALGHRTEIRGELTETADGMGADAARKRMFRLKRFYGKSRSNLPALVTQASEYVYGHTDPVPMALLPAIAPADPKTPSRSFVSRFLPPYRRRTQAVFAQCVGQCARDPRPAAPRRFAKYRAAIALNRNFLVPL